MTMSTCAYRRLGAEPVHGSVRVDHLTDREKEVFLLLGTGLGNRRLANELRISERTVKAHIARIIEKLGYQTRLQTAVLAVLVHDALCADADCTC
ncbi:LuxR C-terminal-related transcriptional regulator [Streptomyces antibioticus]|uniref:LuxR C-terminal-related transcriptional regulator n=1 Tax=Streptomyces antibioticus TaxID=1890 RepID=UPI00195FC17D|nr:helix-turn-helix transcriptional regulator [Streptomyces sp. S9]